MSLFQVVRPDLENKQIPLSVLSAFAVQLSFAFAVQSLFNRTLVPIRGAALKTPGTPSDK